MAGSLVVLTPGEETTLRLIARGARHPRALPESEIVRLQRLGLVAQTRMGLTLTEAGRRCLGGGEAASEAASEAGGAAPSVPTMGSDNAPPG
jgi:hypothetical protein